MTKQALKWTKRLTLVLAIIPILVLLAFAAAVSFIDFNQYKPQIEKEVSQMTNRTLKIEGAVGVSLMPFTFHLGKFHLDNPEPFGPKKFLTVKEANIELSLKKLILENKFEVKALEIIEPKINLIEQANSNNWSGMPLLASLPNTQSNLDSSITKLTLASHAMTATPAQNSGFDASALIKTSQAEVDEKSEEINQTKQVVVPEVVLEGNKNNWFLDSLVVKDAVINYENQHQQFNVSLTRVNVITFDVQPGKPFNINSDFIYHHSESPRSFDFQINSELRLAQNFTQIHMRDWNGVFRLQLPKEKNMPDLRMGTTGQNLMVDIKHQQIYVKDALLNGMNAEILTSFQGEFGANPEFQGVFEAKKINLPQWLKHLDLPAPDMQQKEAFTDLGGQFSFNWDGEALSLDKIDAQIDNTKIQGSLWIPTKNVEESTKLNLQVEDLKSDFYLAQANGESYYPVPLSALQNIKLQGDINFTNVELASLKVKQLAVNIHAQDGQFLLAPLDIEFSQGSLLSKAEVTLAPSETRFYWKGRTEKLALSEMSANIVLQGYLNSRFVLQTSGQNVQQWLANLMGNIQADIAPASIRGVDFNEILSGDVRLDKKARVTELHQVRLLGKITQGHFEPKRFTLDGKQFSAAGVGQLNLANSGLQGELKVNINNTKGNLAALQGKVLPIQFAGNLNQLQWQLGGGLTDESLSKN